MELNVKPGIFSTNKKLTTIKTQNKNKKSNLKKYSPFNKFSPNF